MKLKELKPSVGMMRLWIASIIIIFIITLDKSFNGYTYFKSIFLELFTFINNLSPIDIFSPKWYENKNALFINNLYHAFSATLVYVITSALAYLIMVWIKEGFSKSKDDN